MSDLVADAEDLLHKVAAAQTPEVQALACKLRQSVDRMEDQLRERLRAAAERPSFPWERRNPWPYYLLGASLALAALVGMHSRHRSRRRRN